MDMPSDVVPHFFHDGCDAHIGLARIVEWLQPQGYLPFYVAYPPDSLADVLTITSSNNPDAHYMLFGSTADGSDHVVICHGGEIVHNPALYGCDIVAPATSGMWIIMVIVRL